MAGTSAKKAAHGAAQIAKESSGFPLMQSMVNMVRAVKQTVMPTNRYEENSFAHLKRQPLKKLHPMRDGPHRKKY